MSHSLVARLLAAAAVSVTVAAAPGVAAAPQSTVPAPLVRSAGEALPGRYIVMLESGQTARAVAVAGDASAERAQAAVDATVRAAARRAERIGVEVDDVYTAVGGYSAELTSGQLAQLRRDPAVAYIEEDSLVEGAAVQTQSSAPWQLDRIDQAARPLDGRFTYGATGLGVTAYVVDSGVRADHQDLSGRVRSGFSSVNDGYGTNDCHGHGTGVASLLAGERYGVAKDVGVVPVRVLDCANWGAYSTIISGVDWVASNATLPAVANISIQSSVNSSLDAAVQSVIQRGVSVSVAAGNSSKDACQSSPARVSGALTVGNVDSTDTRRSSSNYGSCVDLFAPGTGVTAAAKTSTTATQSMTGTSMSAPLVAGAAALVLETAPASTPAQVHQTLVAQATTGRLSLIGIGSPNRLLNVSAIRTTTATP